MNVIKTESGWSVESSKTKGIVYHVHYSNALRHMVCDCPDYRIRRIEKGQICKHINAVWDHEKYDKHEKD